MPKPLPANPNLEHLKNQAKVLLHAFRQNQPEAVTSFSKLKLKTAPRLSHAQLLVAREYGFAGWPKLKQHVESMNAALAEAITEAKKALRNDDAQEFRRVMGRYPMLKAHINDPVGDFDSPLIDGVRSKAMLDVLLEAGADINARSKWWAGGFGLLDMADPELAAHAIQRGAVVTVHAAARLGMLAKLKELVSADPALVHARGGDGQTPLHFAATVEIAEYLLDRGADIDARDIDHESTPAQYMLRERQEVARYLVRRGCATDILMATALGDRALVERHLRDNSECIRMRVSDEYFPMISERSGGTIYQWQLGWHVSPHQIARRLGYQEIFDLLMDRSPAEEKLLNACWLHNEALVKSLQAQDPDLPAKLPPAGRRNLAHAARNNDSAAARLMLTAGLPVNAFSQHHATALHWAAFHGNADLASLLVNHGAQLENADNEYQGTPLNWAMYGSENSWNPQGGDYAATVEVLLRAGAALPKHINGTDAVREVLRRYGMKL